MSNVIPARFDQEFFRHISGLIKSWGIRKTIHFAVIDAGIHPSAVGAAVRKVLRERGW